MLKVEFYGKEVIFTDAQQKYGLIRKEFREYATYLKNKLIVEYNNTPHMGAIISKFPVYVEKEQSKVFDLCLKIMQEYGVLISIGEFVNKYYEIMQYYHYIKEPVEAYSNINGEKEKLDALRFAQQEARGKWQGGGFGISGAIKGAMVAGALNWGNDLLHSIGDSATQNSDNKYIQEKLSNLYKQPKTKTLFVEGAYECIMNVADALYIEMEAQGIFEVNTYNSVQASKYRKRAIDNNNVMEMVKALKINPYYIENYKEFIELVGADVEKWCIENNKRQSETNNRIEEYQNEMKKIIRKVAEFCSMEEVCDWIDNENINKLMAKKIRESKAFRYLKNSDVSKKGYWEMRKEYQNIALLFNRGIPKSNYYYSELKSYFDTAEAKWPDLVEDPKYFGYFGIDEDVALLDDNIKDFVIYVATMFEISNSASKVKYTYIIEESPMFKAKAEEVKRRFDYKNLGEMIAIHDSSSTENLRKGVVLYEKAFVDLKNGSIYMISEIEEVDNSQYEKVRLLCKNRRNVTFDVNSIIAEYIEIIAKRYSSYRGRYERRLKQEEESKAQEEKEIEELSQKSGKECLQEGYQFMLQNNFHEAYKRFSAINRSDKENVSLSMIGNSCFFLEKFIYKIKNEDDFLECLENGIIPKEEASDYYKQNIGMFLDFRDKDGRGILQTLLDLEKVDMLKNLMEFEFDYNKLYEDKETLLDIIADNRLSMNGSFAKDCKDLYVKFLKKGAKREWNIQFNRPYKEYENVYDYIVDFFNSWKLKQTSALYWGKSLKDEKATKYTQAIEGLGIPEGERICFLYDPSIMKKCTTGIAISDSGIYYVTEEKKKYHVFWSEINSFEFVNDYEKDRIFLDGHPISVFEDGVASAIGNLQKSLMLLLHDSPRLFESYENEEKKEEQKKAEIEANKITEKNNLKKRTIGSIIATVILLYFFFKHGIIVKIVCALFAASVWSIWKEEVIKVTNEGQKTQDNNGKVCPRCGKIVSIEEKICPNCGKQIE